LDDHVEIISKSRHREQSESATALWSLQSDAACLAISFSPRQSRFPDSRIVIDIEDWFHFSMFYYFGHAAYNDNFVGWITRIKSLWGIS